MRDSSRFFFLPGVLPPNQLIFLFPFPGLGFYKMCGRSRSLVVYKFPLLKFATPILSLLTFVPPSFRRARESPIRTRFSSFFPPPLPPETRKAFFLRMPPFFSCVPTWSSSPSPLRARDVFMILVFCIFFRSLTCSLMCPWRPPLELPLHPRAAPPPTLPRALFPCSCLAQVFFLRRVSYPSPSEGYRPFLTSCPSF